jgi:hypothetical protein
MPRAEIHLEASIASDRLLVKQVCIPSCRMPPECHSPQNDNVARGTLSADNAMMIDERFKYVRKMKERYVDAAAGSGVI